MPETMTPRARFLAACHRQPVDRPPVWIMRQAGRYMPSYQAVRKKVSFMELCRTPELACEVTLMPIEQLGVDAAILFSDILVPLEPMGLSVEIEHRGPEVTPPVRSRADIDRLRVDGAADELGYVFEAVRRIRRAIGPDRPLLGFAGAPWTLASYAVEGGTSRNHHELKQLMYAEPAALEALLDKLAQVVARFLRLQVEAGCDAVQLFDTWGGLLDLPRWRRFSQKYTASVMTALADLDVPIIHYAQGASHLLPGLAELPCQVLSVDWRQPLGEVLQATGGRFALQGNLDPGVLRAPEAVIDAEVRAVLESYGPTSGHIFNLGHGITPDVTVAAARAVVAAVERHGPDFGHGA